MPTDDYLELQSDYYQVYDVACDMVTHLERTSRGDKCSSSIVAELRQKVTTTNEEAEKRMVRKGVPPRRGRSLTERNRRTNLRKCESLHTVPIDPQSPPRDPGPTPSSSEPLVTDLMLSRISNFLLQSPQSRTSALLLQALRQQISVSSCKMYAKKSIDLMIERDILLLRHRKTSVTGTIFLGSESNGLESREQLARFVNAIASFKVGRDYLLSIGQGKELMGQILGCLRTKRIHSQTQDNLLATLQKLSIRSQVQRDLLQLGVLDWLLPILEGRLSSYAQEFGAALLMNLCMCQAGQPTLLKYLDPIIQTLKILTKIHNSSMCPYLNGCIYGLMALGRARSRARDAGFEFALQNKLDRADCTLDEFQLPFLMRQIRGEVEMHRIPLPPVDEEDVAGDNVESDIDSTDSLRASGSEMSGARLLIAKGRKEETKIEEINVPGTVPQKPPITSRTAKKEATVKRARGRVVTFELSRSEPRLATTASQATFIIEHEKRKPCVVTLGLTEAALQYRHQQKEKEKIEVEKRRSEEEEQRKVEEEQKREEEKKRELEAKSKDSPKEKDSKKKGDTTSRATHKHHHHDGKECKRHSIHLDDNKEKKKIAVKSARSASRKEEIKEENKSPKKDEIKIESDQQKSRKVEHAKKEETKTKSESTNSPKDLKNLTSRSAPEEPIETVKEKKKPSPIVLPVDEIVPEAAPVTDKIPKRIPEDANAYEYISVFGARPKVPRTPEKDKKGPTTVLLY
ncbi:unnamed protein product, partial [Mesorhabditis belari]|uniref:LisH domain-containing protein n=1 Tax=Mesorhabditis belari TaxID=2138241 RepID=A0AAF3FG26_9BILA